MAFRAVLVTNYAASTLAAHIVVIRAPQPMAPPASFMRIVNYQPAQETREEPTLEAEKDDGPGESAKEAPIHEIGWLERVVKERDMAYAIPATEWPTTLPEELIPYTKESWPTELPDDLVENKPRKWAGPSTQGLIDIIEVMAALTGWTKPIPSDHHSHEDATPPKYSPQGRPNPPSKRRRHRSRRTHQSGRAGPAVQKQVPRHGGIRG